jgi:RimJ/RimL family protein N-acetyltransferase
MIPEQADSDKLAIERLNVQHLVAKVDPGNVPSEKIVVRIGARRGPVLKDAISRAIDAGKRRDLQCWYLDRPSQVAEGTSNEPE